MTRRLVTVTIDAETFTCGDCCHRTVVNGKPNPLEWPVPFVVCQLYNCRLDGEQRSVECRRAELPRVE